MHTLAWRKAWKLERDGGRSIQALKSVHWVEHRDGEARKAGLGRRWGREKPPPTAQLPITPASGTIVLLRDPSLFCLLAFIPPLIFTCHALPSFLSFCIIPAHLSRLRDTADSSAKTPLTSPKLALTQPPLRNPAFGSQGLATLTDTLTDSHL